MYMGKDRIFAYFKRSIVKMIQEFNRFCLGGGYRESVYFLPERHK